MEKILLKKLEGTFLNQHYYLNENDRCFYFGDYTSKEGPTHSEFNSLIYNFKKEIGIKKDRPELWKYKQEAIERIAKMFKNIFFNNEKNLQKLTQATLIPIPSSKVKANSLYDDRVLQTLNLINQNKDLDIRELIITMEDRPSQSTAKSRLNPSQILEYLQIDSKLKLPTPKEIWLFDDVITTGSTFKACCLLLRKIYLDIPIKGFFIARRSIILEK